MSNSKKSRSAKRRPASRRLETRSAGPTVSPAGKGRRLLLPHERDEAAIPEPRAQVAPNRKLIRRAVRDVEQGLVDTEARGTPANVPTARRRSAKRGAKGSG